MTGYETVSKRSEERIQAGRKFRKFTTLWQGRLYVKLRRSDHIHPILPTLHWLPVTYRIQYIIIIIVVISIVLYLTDEAEHTALKKVNNNVYIKTSNINNIR